MTPILLLPFLLTFCFFIENQLLYLFTTFRRIQEKRKLLQFMVLMSLSLKVFLLCMINVSEI